MIFVNYIANELKNVFLRKYPAYAMLRDAHKAGFSDVNDYLEHNCDCMATNAMKKLFSYKFMQQKYTSILEVGAGTGRFTREILKYIDPKTKIMCLEYSRNYCNFLLKYAHTNNWNQVSIIQADIFNYKPKKRYDVVILPWFDLQMSLFQYNQLLKTSKQILKSKGLLIFDFMDSQDNLVKVVNEPSNSPYFLVNGKDIEKLANHFGFKKTLEFKEKFNKQIAKYHVYQKR